MSSVVLHFFFGCHVLEHVRLLGEYIEGTTEVELLEMHQLSSQSFPRSVHWSGGPEADRIGEETSKLNSPNEDTCLRSYSLRQR